MKKRITLMIPVLLAVFFAAVLFGCTAEADGSAEMNIDYGKRADGSTYMICNGEAQEFFNVADGTQTVLDVTVKKESGTLWITIFEEDHPENAVYEGHDFPAEHFTVTVKEQGSYCILVHAEDFIGSYKLCHDTIDITQ